MPRVAEPATVQSPGIPCPEDQQDPHPLPHTHLSPPAVLQGVSNTPLRSPGTMWSSERAPPTLITRCFTGTGLFLQSSYERAAFANSPAMYINCIISR